MTHNACLTRIWRTTHRDFRALIKGVRYVLAMRDGATCLVPLSALTEAERTTRLQRANQSKQET